MGYSTDFFGQFKIDPPLKLQTIIELDKICHRRHEWIKEEKRHEDNAPGYYCQWITNDCGTELSWDGNERFYGYVEWLEYLCKNMINPDGSKLMGNVCWRGDDCSGEDRGVIYAGVDEDGNQKIKAVNDTIKNGPVPKWYKF